MEELISRLMKKGIYLSRNGDKLNIEYNDDTISNDLLEEIRDNKEEIMRFLIFKNDKNINPVKKSDSYEVSSAQKRLWILSQFDSGSSAYNIPNSFYINHFVDINCLTKAVDSSIERHEILRTVFKLDKRNELRQYILKREELGFRIDCRDFRKDQKRYELVDTFINEYNYKVFDLENGPLLRICLFRLEDNKYVFYYNTHHIINDGWSMGVLQREWSEFYNSELEQRLVNLKPLRIQYKDYSAWHNAQLQSEEINLHKNYWLEQFKGDLPVLELPSDKSRPKVMTYNGASLYRYLDLETTAQLRKLTQDQGGTMFITLHMALIILLHKFTGQEDIIIGSPIAGREHPDLEGQIGFYVNTLALRNQFRKEDSVTELYQKLKHNTLEAFSHQVYPYNELIEDLNLTRDISRNPLFDVMVNYQSFEEGKSQLFFSQSSNLPNEKKYTNFEVSQFDMSFAFAEQSEEMTYSLNYNTDIYSVDQVKRMLSHLQHLLETISTQVQTSVAEYEILPQEEKVFLLDTLNDTKAVYPKDKTIVELFEGQVAKTPASVAIKTMETELTYEQLNEQSNELAHYLIKNYNIQSDELIGIELERSEWMVIGILAIIKSGGAYVPIDPEYPEQRKEFIKDDANLKLIINDQELNKFRQENKNQEYPSTNPNIELNPNNLMYVIYTSGSTGNPKGCMLEHGGLVNRLAWMQKSYALTAKDCILQKTTFMFDVSVWELLWWSVQGASVSLLDVGGEKQPEKIVSTIASTGVTVMHFVPSMLSVFLEYLATSKEEILSLASLQQVYTSGEALQPEQVKRFKELLPTVKLMNLYGPTEASIDVSYYDCETANNINDTDNLIIPIGKPIDNTSIYVLNSNYHLVPFGSIGEICIGGVGLARGYLNRPDLTKEKFITNPYNPNQKLYRTGDLGRWREDGNLEYLGRMDDQVKIRGYRIELGEIEQTLTTHPLSGKAVVIARDIKNATEKELIAYTTGKATAEELKSYLKERLPSYMVPNYYVKMESIPLTSNGKVDRMGLPDPHGTGLKQGEYVAPDTETEKKLVKLWSEVLGIDETTLSINSDFFDLGGNSLKAIKLMIVLNREFSLKSDLGFVFANSNIQEMALIMTSLTYQSKTFEHSIRL